jgi:flagellar basal body-associated protein FliL
MTTNTEKVEMNTNTNQRLVTILLVLLIILLALLVLGIVAGFLMMGGMMGWGGMMSNEMANGCLEMMRNFQGPQ